MDMSRITTRNLVARLAASVLLIAIVALGNLVVASVQPALAVCQDCHVPTPPEDDQDVEPIDWSLYDDIGSDQEQSDAGLDDERRMCVADETSSGEDDNMSSAEDDISSEEDSMTSAEDFMCVAP